VLFAEAPPLEIGKVRKLKDGSDLTIAVCGIPTSMAIEAADRLAQRSVSVDLLEVATIKPIDAEALVISARKTGKVLTIEEHTVHGGLGGAVAEVLSQRAPTRMRMIGIEDRFTESGAYDALLRKYGISVDRIESEAMRLLNPE
jgi:transketolase